MSTGGMIGWYMLQYCAPTGSISSRPRMDSVNSRTHTTCRYIGSCEHHGLRGELLDYDIPRRATFPPDQKDPQEAGNSHGKLRAVNDAALIRVVSCGQPWAGGHCKSRRGETCTLAYTARNLHETESLRTFEWTTSHNRQSPCTAVSHAPNLE